jgi:hypothetical protein
MSILYSITVDGYMKGYVKRATQIYSLGVRLQDVIQIEMTQDTCIK